MSSPYSSELESPRVTRAVLWLIATNVAIYFLQITVQEDLPAWLGFSTAAVNAFIQQAKPTAELQQILDNLAARGLGSYVKIDYQVIRGLAYYTGVVFEAFDRKGEFRAIAGGGRYDNLVKLISGGRVDLPALGFGMGDVVLLELLTARKLLPSFDARVIPADGQFALPITVFASSADGSNLATFTIAGPARIIGVGNGDPKSHEPD